MNITFKRRELQVACESIARFQQKLPSTSNEYKFKDKLMVTSADIAFLQLCQRHDSVSFYYNAILSFLQALKSIKSKSYSWATVQLYYSVFYSCKAILGFDQIGIIRKKGLHKLELKVGETAKGFNRDNDHKQTIKCFQSRYPNAFILSNSIGDQNFFEWIQDAREITNYRQQVFQEPGVLGFLETIVDRIKNGESFYSMLNRFSADWSIYCFQEDSALIAGPYYLLYEAYEKYKVQCEKISVPEKKKYKHLKENLN